MLDEQIIELFWQRNQAAIEQLDEKYGAYCHSISYRILYDHLDAEECVNDSYLSTWNAIPPHRPEVLPAFVGRIVRNLSLDYLKKRNRKKEEMVNWTWFWKNYRMLFHQITTQKMRLIVEFWQKSWQSILRI